MNSSSHKCKGGMEILVIIHTNVYKIDVSIFSVRKKKSLLKESKVWILIPEQLLQPIFRRYFGGFLVLILGIFGDGILYCRKGIAGVQVNHICDLHIECFIFSLDSQKDFMIEQFWVLFLESTRKQVGCLMDFLVTCSKFSSVKSLCANFFVKHNSNPMYVVGNL